MLETRTSFESPFLNVLRVDLTPSWYLPADEEGWLSPRLYRHCVTIQYKGGLHDAPLLMTSCNREPIESVVFFVFLV